MSAKRRHRAIAAAVAKRQKKDPSYVYKGVEKKKKVHKIETVAYYTDSGLRVPASLRDEYERLDKLIASNHDVMREVFDPLPLRLEGEDVDGTVMDLRLMGRELDFSISKRKKRWNEFTTIEGFERSLQRMRVITNPNYIRDRVRLYKRNFTNSLLETYGDQARDIAMKIRMMKTEEYMKMVEADESLEIGYYGKSDEYIPGMLNKIRRSLGMKEKSEDENI